MASEIWKEILGYNKRYEASSLGRIRSLISGRGTRTKPLILKPSLHRDGYLDVNVVNKSGKKTKARVNRLVCGAFHGSPKNPNFHAAHLDGNEVNNIPTNLQWISKSDNEQMKKSHGTAYHPQKLTKGQVNDIVRRKKTEPISNVQLGKEYGVSDRMIGKILNGDSWVHSS